MHSRDIAHRNIGGGDILMNFGGSSQQSERIEAQRNSRPFRSLFSKPCKYYFIGFEACVYLPYGAEGDSRRASGFPLIQAGRIDDPKQYRKVKSWFWSKQIIIPLTFVTQQNRLYRPNGFIVIRTVPSRTTSTRLVVCGVGP